MFLKNSIFRAVPSRIQLLASISCKNKSTNVAVKEETEKNSQLQEYDELKKMTRKELKKKPMKEPFVKNLFLGKFDTDILAYPEVFKKDELSAIYQQLREVDNALEEIDYKKDTSSQINEGIISTFKKLRLFGSRLPQILGGRELSVTENCMLTETISENTGKVGWTHNDQLGIQTIYNNGSEEQKAKYLHRIMSGNSLCALCMSEANSYDPRSLQTKATLSADKTKWIINGQKDWIINGSNADLLIVFARTSHINPMGLQEDKISAFIVERGFGGVTSSPCDAQGLEGTDISTVIFQNTPIPAENIMGSVNEGDKIASSFLTEFRLSTGSICSTITRTLINKFIDFCKSDKFKMDVAETEIIQLKISKMIVSLYAMESITYLTAGLLDQYENQDCELEAAIVKVFSSDNCYKTVKSTMEFFGTPAYMKSHWANELGRNALGHVLFHETNDNLKIIISLLGLQFAGTKIQDDIKVLRNPMFNASQIFKRMWIKRKQMEDNPTLTLQLKHYLHPSLMLTSEKLEYCVLRLQFAIESFLARHGSEVVNKHTDLQRLAESVIDIYAMTACIGRASRSYCIGLSNAEFEMDIAHIFCHEALSRVKNNLKEVCDGLYGTTDSTNSKISKQAFHCGAYYLDHPTARNY